MRKLLNDFYEIHERQYMSGDYGATDEIIDLQRAILAADLTEKQQEALRLYYIEDKKQEEIGLVTKQSQEYVHQLISSSVNKIAKNM